MEYPQAFFCVWNTQRSAPTVKHRTFHLAQAEAKRLARQCPDEDFYVLKAVSHARKNDVLVTAIDRDEIPF